MSGVRLRLVGAIAVVSLALAGCSGTAQDGPTDVLEAMSARQSAGAAQALAQTAPAATPAAAASTCSPPANASYPALASLPAPGSIPAASSAGKIKARGALVVGVSGDTRLLGYRDSLDGGKLKGFDVELARAVGRAIFGTDGKVQFRVITAGQRFDLVNKGAAPGAGGVDLVARAVSMTCDRWQNPDPTKGSLFSAGYFKSEQRLLVRSDLAVTVDGIGKLKAPNNRVCAPTGSTSLANLAKSTNVASVAAEIHSDCLALWQQGRVDAITGDDAILAGFAAQDPRARVVGDSLDTTYYAFAVGRNQPDLVQFVNAVMASPAFQASWTAAYGTHLGPNLPGQAQTQPVPVYGRPLGR